MLETFTDKFIKHSEYQIDGYLKNFRKTRLRAKNSSIKGTLWKWIKWFLIIMGAFILSGSGGLKKTTTTGTRSAK